MATVTIRRVSVAAPPAYDATRVRSVRHRLGVSQRVFAATLNVSLATVRSWEQGSRTPDGPSVRLLHLAERHPDVILEAVSER